MRARSPLEQTISGYLKVARTAVWLKYRVLADEEINDVLPKLQIQLEAMAQKGELPSLSTGDLFKIAEQMEART